MRAKEKDLRFLPLSATCRRFLIFPTRLCFSFLYFILTVCSLTAFGQEPGIRVDTNLVTVPVTVLDRDGRYITNLVSKDFQVFEDGIEQTIEFFEPIEKSFTVMFVLDRSGSMSGQYRSVLTNAVNVFIKQLRPNDELIAATFADSVVSLVDKTKVANLKKSLAISGLSSDRTTLLFDAMDYAFNKMKRIKSRKAVILFSDGVGDGYFSSAKENLKDAEETDTIVYAIQFDTSSKVEEKYRNARFYEGLANAHRYMRELARLTGGRHLQIENIDDLSAKFSEIADELGRQYRLGYYPKNSSPGRKQIKVKVGRPDVVVRSRESYVVEK
ncbi:MAG: VWA domain-containing protein [Pyrinomonadaceae bacterium]|nr:VWA domain-containing protein [Blastocatellia bacterium]MCW5956638.1 VWA domain-containing protein [Pyrinomonadaceae bacterium]